MSLKTEIKARFTESSPILIANTHQLYILQQCNNIVCILKIEQHEPDKEPG